MTDQLKTFTIIKWIDRKTLKSDSVLSKLYMRKELLMKTSKCLFWGHFSQLSQFLIIKKVFFCCSCEHKYKCGFINKCQAFLFCEALKPSCILYAWEGDPNNRTFPKLPQAGCPVWSSVAVAARCHQHSSH